MWVDVYDLSDPSRPVWIDVAAAPVFPYQLHCTGNFLWAVDTRDQIGYFEIGPAGVLSFAAHHSLSGSPHVFTSIRNLESGLFYLQQFGSTPFKLGVWNGNPNDTPFFFEPELPKGGEDIRLAPGMTGDRGRLFMTFQRMEGITEIARGIAAYDVTKNPPTLLGAVDLERSQLPLFQLDIVDDRTLVQISFRVSG